MFLTQFVSAVPTLLLVSGEPCTVQPWVPTWLGTLPQEAIKEGLVPVVAAWLLAVLPFSSSTWAFLVAPLAAGSLWALLPGSLSFTWGSLILGLASDFKLALPRLPQTHSLHCLMEIRASGGGGGL